jgi:hypothetical protein
LYRFRYPTLYKWVKRAVEAVIVVAASYLLGLVGLWTIVQPNGLYFWNFWFGGVYSFVFSDYVSVILERRGKKFMKYQALRIAFFLAGLYASAEVTLAYSAVFNRFINDPPTVQWVGYLVFGLSAGTLLVPYGYFRWKYREKPVEPDQPVILEGL